MIIYRGLRSMSVRLSAKSLFHIRPQISNLKMNSHPPRIRSAIPVDEGFATTMS